MQTLTIGAYRATLASTRDVGAFRAQLAKCLGKPKRRAIVGGVGRVYPRFGPAMSTADYVRAFESANSCHSLKSWAWQPLNDAPCTLYSGEDSHEELPGGFEDWEEFDAAQGVTVAPETADPLPGDARPKPMTDGALRMLETVLQPLQNAAPDGVPTAQGLESEAGRIDATAERMRAAAPQYAAECAEVARSLRELAEVERERTAPVIAEPTEQMRAFWRRQQYSGQPLDTIYAAIAQPGHQQPAGYCLAWYARDAGRAALEAAREPCTSVRRFDPPGSAAPDAPPAIPDAIEASAREIIDAMPAIDLYDYLADYTDREPRDEDNRHPDAMRSAVLDEMRRSGAAQFLERMRPTAPAIPGLDVADLGADGMAEFEAAQREPVEITAASYRRTPPPLRIPATDPRARIPARFAPGYLLHA